MVADVFVDGVEYIVEPDVDGLRGVPVGMPVRPVRATLPGCTPVGGRSGRVSYLWTDEVLDEAWAELESLV